MLLQNLLQTLQHSLQSWLLPSAIPTDSDLSTGCSPSPPAQHSMQTAILPLLAFPMDAPLPTLALPVTHLPTSMSCISSPSSAPLAQPHPVPASVPAADLQPLHSCWPSLLSQTPAPNFQTLQKLGLCDRPPHLAPAASACCRHPWAICRHLSATFRPPPQKSSLPLPGLYPGSLPLFLQHQQ